MKDRKILKFLIDLILWTLALPIAYILRLDGLWYPYANEIGLLVLLSVPVIATIIYFVDFYRQSWHNISIRDLIRLSRGIFLFTVLLITASFIPGNFLFIPLSEL